MSLNKKWPRTTWTFVDNDEMEWIYTRIGESEEPKELGKLTLEESGVFETQGQIKHD